ncbi:hypothetical protein GCM10027290_63580 [Micromonospora sonneratiae]|uniref:BTAD domain-containing putative transcriptional regulator n=1 Tax=Micromonospora sonneratiae TaxID=1184706 RepID=A0ABW3YKS6_9ACTN
MAESNVALWVDVLGPVEVRRGPRLISLGPRKQRAVFACLALRVDRVVSVDWMIRAIWGETQIPSARHLVYTYVARLRGLLEPHMPRRQRTNVISPAPNGYRLTIDARQVDIMRFRSLVAHARQLTTVGARARAFELLGEAIRLWRDPDLTELRSLLRAESETDSLYQDWVEAALEYVTIGLDQGLAAVVLSTAERLAKAEPINEAVQARYLSALAGTGQRASAVARFAELRQQLETDLGVEPGPELLSCYREIVTRAQHVSPVHGLAPQVGAVRPLWRGPGPVPGELVAREEDLTATLQFLSERRLVTMVGPAGSGKSALALQAADRIRDSYTGGVLVADISEFWDREQIDRHLLDLVDAPAGTGDLARVLGDQQLLLVLDNVEHLVDGCAVLIDRLVRACRHVSVIVTSREPVGLPHETVWRVRPLPTPQTNEYEDIRQSSAVRLFAQRAAQASPGFRVEPSNASAVAVVCRRLDGLPLALELAAAAMTTDGINGLLQKLDDPLARLTPLRRGFPLHQRTLREALYRSVECLTPAERLCFVRLGVLPPRFPLSEAMRVCQLPPHLRATLRATLDRLVYKSLLTVEQSESGPIYQMLTTVHLLASQLCALGLGELATVSPARRLPAGGSDSVA